jgi:hypothetical protein
MARTTKLSELPKNKNVYDVEKELTAGVGRCMWYGGKQLSVIWDFNQRAKDNGVCLIKIGDQEAYVKAEDLRRFLRWV